jgi:hypothetical protein
MGQHGGPVGDQTGGVRRYLFTCAGGAGDKFLRRLLGQAQGFSRIRRLGGGTLRVIGKTCERRHIGLRADQGDRRRQDGPLCVGEANGFRLIGLKQSKNVGGAAEEFGGAGMMVPAQVRDHRVKLMEVQIVTLSQRRTGLRCLCL